MVSHFYVKHHFASSCGPEEVFVQGLFGFFLIIITVFLAYSSSCKSTRCLHWLFEWTSKLENNNFKLLHILNTHKGCSYSSGFVSHSKMLYCKKKNKQHPNPPKQNNPQSNTLLRPMSSVDPLDWRSLIQKEWGQHVPSILLGVCEAKSAQPKPAPSPRTSHN